jgi:hypothetical protein
MPSPSIGHFSPCVALLGVLGACGNSGDTTSFAPSPTGNYQPDATSSNSSGDNSSGSSSGSSSSGSSSSSSGNNGSPNTSGTEAAAPGTCAQDSDCTASCDGALCCCETGSGTCYAPTTATCPDNNSSSSGSPGSSSGTPPAI